jgi:hypothetical protein
VPHWYPGCKVRLKIRLEDNALEAPTPSAAAPSAAGSEAFGSGSIDDIFPGASSFIAVGQDIVPESCTVELNSYRQADSAKMTIDVQRLPVNPLTIRAIAVSVFGGVYSPSEWGAANGPAGAQGLLLPDAPTLETGVPDSTGNYTWELFRGFADAVDLELGADDETLTINCRDLTGPLLDAEVPPNALAGLPGFLTLDQGIQLLLTGDGVADPELSARFGLPGFRGIVVKNEVSDASGAIVDLPTFDEARPKAWVDSSGTVRKGRRKSPRNTQKISYWDMITDIVNTAGFIVFMRVPRAPVAVGNQTVLPAAEIVISNPRTIYRAAVGAGDDYIPPAKARTFIRGYNAESIKTKRNLQGTSVPTIRVQAFLTDEGVLVQGTYPDLPKNNRPTPTGTGDRTEVKIYNLDQISGTSRADAEARLRAAARSIYEQLARGDFEVTIESMSLSALPDRIEDGISGDLFALRTPDSIIVEVPAQSRITGQVNESAFLSSASIGERIAAGITAGLDERAAQAFAIAQSSPALQSEFRTRQITWTWDGTGDQGGWSSRIEAINYLDVRDSIQVTDTRTGVQE